MIDIKRLSSDLSAQIAAIKSGHISATDLAKQQMALIQLVNDKLNAFISIAPDFDVTASKINSTSPLAGISVAVKDNIDVFGFNTTAGLEILRHNQPQQDAFVIDKLRNAGAVFSGKLNMHEGALGASNHNAHFGNCYNPNDLTATPGGSSGGSSAAVAACLTPLALGTDTMGSVRIPASYCGVFGFKATRGAISNSGSVACSRMMDNIGSIARSARDLSLAFELMQGFDIDNAESKSLDYQDQLPANPELLVPDNLLELGVEADVITDFEHNIKIFEQMGCSIKRFSFGCSVNGQYDFGAARRAGLIICEAEMRVEHGDAWKNQIENFSPYLKSLLSYIDRKSPMDVIKSQRDLEKAVVLARHLFTQGDFLLMPTAPQRAFKMNGSVPANQADLTSFANHAGLCAVSIPMITEHKMPAGMQIMGAPNTDRQVLSLAEQWQQLSGFEYQVPAIVQQLIQESN